MSTISSKLADILTKELAYAEFASDTLKSELRVFEKEHDMNSDRFLEKFEKGELGDERVWFKWYGLALSAKDWNEIKTEIAKTLRTA